MKDKEFTKEDNEVASVFENKEMYSQKQFVKIADMVGVLQKRRHYKKWWDKVAQNLYYRDLFKNTDNDDLMEIKVSFRKNNTQERSFIARTREKQELMRDALNECGASRFNVILEPLIPQPNFCRRRSEFRN